MKKTLLLGSLCVSLLSFSQTFTDNFDAYTAGQKLGSQSNGAWTTWGGTPGGADDILVTNDVSSSAPNALHFQSTTQAGGPADIVRHFGVMNTGQFDLQFKMKVGTGKAGYFNLQKTATLNGANENFALSVYFRDNGKIAISEAASITPNYPVNSWFTFKLSINFNTNKWEIFLDNVSVGSWSNAVNQVEAIDLYAVDTETPYDADFYIDDFSTTKTVYTLPTVNAAVLTAGIAGYNAVANNVQPTFKLRNLGVNPITSFAIAAAYNGNTINQTFTGVNLASLAEQTFTMTGTHVLVAGTNALAITASNVNNAGADGDANDNVATTDITPIVLANTFDATVDTVIVDSAAIVGEDSRVLFVVKNLGVDTLKTFKATATYNGATINQTFIEQSITCQNKQTYTFTTPIIFGTGTRNLVVKITNINGGADQLGTNDADSVALSPIVVPAGRIVVTEEGTGTWCGFCTRGTVFMDRMQKKYGKYWAGVAVHNADPMAVTAYNAGVTSLPGFTGFPTAFVDRVAPIDPAAMEASIITRLQTTPKASLKNGAQWDEATRTLKVSLTSTFAESATNNHKMLIALTENHVTGTDAGYNQSNYYGNFGQGVEMGGFELLPTSVPAAQMVYEHVARAIQPSFAGTNSAFPATIPVGGVYTLNATFVLPAGWNPSKMHIIGMLLDNTGKINNAGQTTIAEAVANGFVQSSSATNEITTLEQVDDQFQVYPNPTSSNTTVLVQLKNESDVTLRILDMSGKEISARNYGTLNGASQIEVPTALYKAGVYIVELTVNNEKMVKRLVVE